MNREQDYRAVFDYVTKNGIHTYGTTVAGTPAAILQLLKKLKSKE